MTRPGTSPRRSPAASGGGGGGTSAADGKALVRDAVDLVKLVGETVQLKKAGRRYVGLCPFHSEKSPSFGVDPAKQFFYCFGCKKGGDCFNFVMERDRVEFRAALETLAEWAGVDLPKFDDGGRGDRLQTLRDACSAAAEIYRRALHADEGKLAREYLEGRGFDKDTLDRFGLGFAPPGWDALARHGLAKKFGEDVLLEAGLIKQGDRGRYDVFRNRVIFPIRDEQGRPIAFGGRVLPGDDSPAKYLNSPETPLFSKSRVLFGLDLAKRPVVETKTAVVFEGYADAAMAHQHGITNAVAVLGTSLTGDHAATLRRLAERVVLLFDADAAGGVATRRSVELFLREPIEVAVAELPAGTDPDEFLQQHGADALRQRIDAAADAITHQFRVLTRGLGDGVTGRQRATAAFLDLLAEAKREAGGAVDQMRWGAVLVRASRLTGLSADDLNRRFAPPAKVEPRAEKGAGRRPWLSKEEYRRQKNSPINAGPRLRDVRDSAAEATTAAERAERWLLGALFNDPSLWEQAQAHVGEADFAGRQTRFLAGLFWDHLRNEGEPTFAEWLEVVETRVLAGGGGAESAARAREACVSWSAEAEALGEPRAVASEAVRGLLRLRGQAGVDELLGASRRNAAQEPAVASSGEPGPETAGSGSELLRELEERLRRAGRA